MSAVLQPPIAERSDQIGSREGGIYLGTWGTCRFMCHRGFSGYALDQARGAYYAYNDRADELEDGELVDVADPGGYATMEECVKAGAEAWL